MQSTLSSTVPSHKNEFAFSFIPRVVSNEMDEPQDRIVDDAATDGEAHNLLRPNNHDHDHDHHTNLTDSASALSSFAGSRRDEAVGGLDEQPEDSHVGEMFYTSRAFHYDYTTPSNANTATGSTTKTRITTTPQPSTFTQQSSPSAGSLFYSDSTPPSASSDDIVKDRYEDFTKSSIDYDASAHMSPLWKTAPAPAPAHVHSGASTQQHRIAANDNNDSLCIDTSFKLINSPPSSSSSSSAQPPIWSKSPVTYTNNGKPRRSIFRPRPKRQLGIRELSYATTSTAGMIVPRGSNSKFSDGVDGSDDQGGGGGGKSKDENDDNLNAFNDDVLRYIDCVDNGGDSDQRGMFFLPSSHTRQAQAHAQAQAQARSINNSNTAVFKSKTALFLPSSLLATTRSTHQNNDTDAHINISGSEDCDNSDVDERLDSTDNASRSNFDYNEFEGNLNYNYTNSQGFGYTPSSPPTNASATSASAAYSDSERNRNRDKSAFDYLNRLNAAAANTNHGATATNIKTVRNPPELPLNPNTIANQLYPPFVVNKAKHKHQFFPVSPSSASIVTPSHSHSIASTSTNKSVMPEKKVEAKQRVVKKMFFGDDYFGGAFEGINLTATSGGSDDTSFVTGNKKVNFNGNAGEYKRKNGFANFVQSTPRPQMNSGGTKGRAFFGDDHDDDDDDDDDYDDYDHCVEARGFAGGGGFKGGNGGNIVGMDVDDDL